MTVALPSAPAPSPLREEVRRLNSQYGTLDAPDLIAALLTREFPDGQMALVSSFGTESAVLLHMVAVINPKTPVLFVDTYKLFADTYAYVAQLTEKLGLEDVRHLRAPVAAIREHDPDSDLWSRNPDQCCHIRKVLPLQEGLKEQRAWITGRKRHHGGNRQKLPVFEEDGTHIKVNPLADWGADRIDTYFGQNHLPGHPLLATGLLSVGCIPCTSAPSAMNDPRSGRWQGTGKTECGIHTATDYEI